MKTSRSTTNKQSKQGASKKPRPEIRDDMDSHKNKKAKDKAVKEDKEKAVKKTVKAKREQVGARHGEELDMEEQNRSPKSKNEKAKVTVKKKAKK
jgi:hypothetical protein